MSAPASTSGLSVQKTLTVEASQEQAFKVFAEKFGSWWPLKSHHIGKAAAKAAVLEPRDGGRWYEIGEDGSECNWGKVLVWDPPHRLVLAWQIAADWQYDPSIESEVEVRFTADGPHKTRVDFEHRKLETYGEKAAIVQKTVSSEMGWPSLLQGYVAFANKTSGTMANIAGAFRMGGDVLTKSIENVPDADWFRRPSDSTNHLMWVTGHMVLMRGIALRMLGQTWSAPWEALFWRGGTVVEQEKYPSPKEMLAAWQDVANRLPAALDSAADDTLSAPPPPQIPCYDGRISGVLAFIAFHEGYHAGQASYLRKWLGHGRVAG